VWTLSEDNHLRFGPYKIEAALGSGGMGKVFLAHDTRLNRKVAIKILHPHLLAASGSRERFQREAESASALNHPNICAIYDIGESEGQPYIVMERLSGETLRDQLTRGVCEIDRLLDISIQTAEALEAAHSQRIIHRDIKPANIFITNRGQVKVMDFGIAKMLEEEVPSSETAPTAMSLTETGSSVGTLTYMSPEQARGEPLDVRTDLFSLGVVLYEMATGVLPFRGNTPAVLFDQILNQNPVAPQSLRPEVPGRLQEIIQSLLAKTRQARIATAAELKQALQECKKDWEAGHQRRDSVVRVSTLNTKTLLWLIAAVVVILALSVSVKYLPRRVIPDAGIHSVAVLPFRNVSGDSSQGDFVGGLTDSFTNELSHIGALRVVSRSATLAYRDSGKTVSEVGRELNADAILDGSISRSGDHVIVSATLIRASDGRQLWANSYEAEVRDLLTLQRQLSREVSDTTKLQLSEREQARLTQKREVNPEAYELYLRGRFHAERENQEDNNQAIELYEKSAALDPKFEATQAELARMYGLKSFYFNPDPQWEEKGFVAVQKALQLDPAAAEAHFASGIMLWRPSRGFPHQEALAEYRQAVTSQPNFDEAWHQRGLILIHLGHLDQGLQSLERAVSINPANTLALFRIGVAKHYQGKWEEALATYDRVPRVFQPVLRSYQRTWALISIGKEDEALKELTQGLQENPTDTGGLLHSTRAFMRARSGDRKGAEDDIAAAVKLGKGYGHFHHTAYSIACTYSTLGDVDKAFEWLDNAAKDGFPNYSLFEIDPSLERLRNTAQFKEFVRKLRQQWEHIPGEPG
jgi:non-specific serine/threonine protein kinase